MPVCRQKPPGAVGVIDRRPTKPAGEAAATSWGTRGGRGPRGGWGDAQWGADEVEHQYTVGLRQTHWDGSLSINAKRGNLDDRNGGRGWANMG